MIEGIMKPKDWYSFWAKIQTDGSCWIWLGYKDKKGYGKFSIHKIGTARSSFCFSAYRLSYQLFKGEIPTNYQIDHLCRNRSCVNPDHLDAVTCQENILRGIGICSNNKRKTHCPQGHKYDETNTYLDKNNGRYCRKCRTQTQKRYLEKKSVM